MTTPPSPFITYRSQLDVYHAAVTAGWSDDRYVAEVEAADERIAAVAGVGFTTTPLTPIDTPLDRLVLAKVETANVGGSHKARHLFGLLLWIMIEDEATGRPQETLAIASCGNAALGAATVARAADRDLRVFVPVDADPLVLADLERLEARVEVCERSETGSGDPCMTALEDALASGDRPFTVQGPLAPHVIDGGRTLGLELAQQLADRGDDPTDLYVQIGGGALATAVMDGLGRARQRPRLHPVQARAAHPYVAAWDRIRPLLPTGAAPTAEEVDAVLDASSDEMEPWPTVPMSVATGILDDITYDWKSVVRHQVLSGGWPVLVTEEQFLTATELAAGQITPPPDPTGAAGLAGLLADRHPSAGSAPAVVLLTGVDRAWTGSIA